MPKAKKPKQLKRPRSEAVKAAADRAEARSAGKPIDKPKAPIDGPTPAELMEAAKATRRRYEAKARLSYTPELAERICDAMLERDPDTGLVRSLTEVCRDDPGLPHEETVRRWRRLHPEFAAMYNEAREQRAHLIADELVMISDTDPDPNRARIRIHARQWWASRVNRGAYGEASAHAVHLTPIPDDDSGVDRNLARRVALVLQQMLARRQAAQVIEAAPIEDDEDA
jgi:hypothetical protein